jgi:hypothetical protein
MAESLFQKIEVQYYVPYQGKLIGFRSVFYMKDYYPRYNKTSKPVCISDVFTYPLDEDEPLSYHRDVRKAKDVIFQEIICRVFDSYEQAVDAINTTAESSVPIHLNLHFVD